MTAENRYIRTRLTSEVGNACSTGGVHIQSGHLKFQDYKFDFYMLTNALY